MSLVPTGPEKSTIAIVDDYCHTTDKNEGYILGGSWGNSINQSIQIAGLKPNSIYKTALCKKPIRAPSKKEKKDPISFLQEQDKENFDNYILQISEELDRVQPNVIVPIGETALRLLTEGVRGLTNYRGSMLPLSAAIRYKTDNLHNVRIIPTIHPTTIFKSFKSSNWQVLDFRRIKKYSNIREPIEEDFQVWVCRKVAHLYEFIKKNKGASYVTLDIETWNTFITCIGLCCDGKEGVCIPLLDKDIPKKEVVQLVRLLAQWLPTQKIVNQNILYDDTYMTRFGIPLNVMDDTMNLQNTLYQDTPKDLGFLTSIWTEMVYFKGEGKEFNPKLHSLERLYFYNAKDCVSAWRIYEAQVKEAKEDNLWEFHKKGPQRFYPLYKDMTLRGIRVDHFQRFKLIKQYESEYISTWFSLCNYIGYDINPNSPIQVAILIYDIMGCKKYWHTTPEGKKVLSTDEDTIQLLILNHLKKEPEGVKILKTLLLLRKLYRIIGYLNAFVHPDGRLHTIYKLHDNAGGRTSTSKEIGGETIDYRYVINSDGTISRVALGLAFQTIPKHGFEDLDGNLFGKDLRSIFVPTEGYCFLEGDQSQAEARVVAILCKDMFLLNKFDEGGVHEMTASWVYNKPESEIKNPSFERQIGKKTRHAGNYDMGANRFAVMAMISFSNAEAILQVFHSKSPSIREVFHENVRLKIRKDRTLHNPFGRRRFIMDRLNDHTFKSAFSWYPQSTVADQTKFSMVRISEKWKAPDMFWIVENHDSATAEVKIEKKMEFAADFKREMERPIDLRKGSFYLDLELVIPFECEVSNTNWMQMKRMNL